MPRGTGRPVTERLGKPSMPRTSRGININAQLALPLGHDRESLRRRLERSAGRPVTLVLTDNSSSLFSMRTRGRHLSVRLHRMFLEADCDVIDELAAYIGNKRGKTPLFWKFVRGMDHRIRNRPPRKTRMREKGRHHDLGSIFHSLNAGYFGGALGCGITWSHQHARRYVRNRTLGSYSPHSDTIRISPSLDSKSVPRYYLEFIVYHEMLHAHLGVENKDGRRRLHAGEFKKRERLFRHYERALAWEKRRWP